ncbi:hypothetical protein ACFL6M_01405 [Candidatus Eisenbacteria bacterium]|uniref:Zinc-finger domain-containing protein n=1 Tax=Eiseniibacteriota bacterium TaxID=2212470 RepID=A0ABV6YIR1_UNCEI
MCEGCHKLEELVAIAELASDDPGRRHLDSCARCQARLETYLEFMRADGECRQDQIDWALDRLGEKLDGEILGTDGQGSGSEDVRKRSLFHFRSPLIRSALAVAACLLLYFALDGVWDRTTPGDNGSGDILLRSDDSAVQTGEIALATPDYIGNGGVELRWQPYPEAESYIVRILDTQLDEVARIPVGLEALLRLDSSRQQDLPAGEGVYAWIVIAISRGDEIAHSKPSSFHLGPGS